MPQNSFYSEKCVENVNCSRPRSHLTTATLVVNNLHFQRIFHYKSCFGAQCLKTIRQISARAFTCPSMSFIVKVAAWNKFQIVSYYGFWTQARVAELYSGGGLFFRGGGYSIASAHSAGLGSESHCQKCCFSGRVDLYCVVGLLGRKVVAFCVCLVASF